MLKELKKSIDLAEEIIQELFKIRNNSDKKIANRSNNK